MMQPQEQECRVFGYRWLNLATYVVVCFMAGMGFAAMAPMLDSMAERWGISLGAAALVMTAITVWQILLSIPSGILAGKIGFKPLVAGGSTLLALGYFLRSTTNSYNMFLVYCLIAGVGWGLIWAPVGCLVANWFPRREIGQANSYWPVGLSLGQAFGSLTSLAFLTSVGWNGMWRIYGVISIVIAVLAWLGLKEKPVVPPEPRPPLKPPSVGEGLKQVMTKVTIPLQYTVLATVGSLAVTPSLVAPLLIRQGVPPAAAGMAGGMSLVGGAIGSFFLPTFAFRSRRIRLTMLICGALSPIFFIAMFYVPVSPGAVWLPILLSFLFGFFTSPLMGMSMGIGTVQPQVNPTNVGMLSGIYLTSIGLGAAIIPQIVTRFVDALGTFTGGAWVETVLLLISLSVIFFTVHDPKAPPGPPPGE